MKPYGQKKKKSKLGMHSSDLCACPVCNTKEWKIKKSRERVKPKEERDEKTESGD